MMSRRVLPFLMSASTLLCPALGSAQTSDAAGVAGVVRDGSGAVLPGVTIEVASPVLIERIRSSVTDGQGLYRIIDLRPGVYTVTFTLPGFSTVKREALELAGGFTATINAELPVGDLAETITVTGESPVVDLQNVRQQTTVQRATLDVLPTTGRVNHLAAIIPGATLASAATHSVGGLDERGQYGIHGGSAGDNAPIVAGMNQRLQQGAAFVFNNLAFEQVTVETQGMSADRSTGGVQMTIIPKDGGNRLSGTVRSIHTAPSWQASNVTSDLRARGLSSTPAVKKHYDTGFGVGGPVARDRLWYFGAARWQVNQQYQQGNFYNKLQGTLFYEADPTRLAHSDDYFKDYGLRLTWQAAQKHKIVASFNSQRNQFLFGLLEPVGATAAPEAVGAHVYGPNAFPLATWTYAVNNKLLIEAGASANIFFNNTKRRPGVDELTIQVTDTLRNYRYGSRGTGVNHAGGYRVQFNEQYHDQVSLSYVTGRHNFKVGFNHDLYIEGKDGRANDWSQINQARSYTFRDRTPLSVTIWAIPFEARQQGRDIATFVQDQWSIARLTLNVGVRVNNLVGSVPETHLPAGPFVPARSFPAVTNVPNYWNINPRVGAAYDLVGNGKTAVKFSLGRFNPYGAVDGAAAPGAVDIPAVNQAASTTRNWSDANGNYVPDCDLRSPIANGECGPWSDLTFGQIRAVNTRRAPDALEGVNRQFYNWRGSVSVQREIAPNMALNVGYHRTWYGGFLTTDNLAVTPADFDPFCLTAPRDGRLPGGGGHAVCGLQDIKPEKFGLVNNLVTLASHYGTQTRVYNGMDATLNARFGRSGQFSGGVSTGRTSTNECFVVDSPQQARPGFCDITPPWSAETQVKFMVIHPLVWDVQASAIYQNISGIPIAASYVASNAEVAGSLGRNLGSCGGRLPCTGTTAAFDIIPTRTEFEDRLQQIDLRFSRVFRLGARARLQGNLDLYNVTNSGNILNMTTRIGPAWLNAIQIMGGRLMKVSAQFDF
jgi:hypothetical protein